MKNNYQLLPLWKYGLLLWLLLALARHGEAQNDSRGFWPFRINHLDKVGRYHGRWKVYLGEGKEEKVIRNGRFRHGREVGTWKYYYTNGTLYMLEKYDRRSDRIHIQKFYENGQLAKEGEALQISTPTRDHYYWQGEWKVYDQQGHYTHIEIYSSGILVGRK